MSVEFYKDNKKEHRWHVLEEAEGVGDPDIVHACHEGFSSEHNALQNLIINQTLMSIFVATVARGNGEAATGNVYFEPEKNGEKVRWKIRADNNEIVGQAHKGFDDTFEAMQNLLITYTMLTMFVAQVAQARVIDVAAAERGG